MVGIRNQNNSCIIPHSILSLLVLVSGVFSTRAGDLKGKVNIEADAIAVVVQGVKGTSTAPDSHAIMDQRNMRFDPLLLPVVVGTTVDFPNNEDVIYHNVFSISEPKPFELGTYRVGQSRSVTFDRPGIVEIFCLIHTRMYAVVPVLDNRYFSIVDANGEFEVKNIPTGDYTVKCILAYSKQQEYKEISKEVFISQHGTSTLNFREEKP